MAKNEKYREGMFLSTKDKMGSIVEESSVRKQGMTLDQCRDIINCIDGVSATSTNTDETNVDVFRETLKMVLNSPERNVN